MKRILIGTIVGTIIFFACQAAMWIGGLHNDLWTYSPKQDSVLQSMKTNGLADGLYLIPSLDLSQPGAAKASHDFMEKNVGKPWTMVFYHTSMHGDDPATMLRGAFHSLIACLMVALILYYGRFSTFGRRFLVSMAVALFAICLGPMNEMNWWSFPWSFTKAAVLDLSLGWGVCSLWLAYYVKNKAA